MTRLQIYASILALIALYALMGSMDRAWLEAEAVAQPWSVSTIRSSADEFAPWDYVAVLPMVESWECR